MKLAKKLVGLGAAAAMSLAFATATFADIKTQDVEVTIQGGGLSLDVPNLDPISNITLTKERDSYNVGFDGNFTIRDLTGTQAGWKLSVSATQLTEINSGYGLPFGSLTIKPPKNVVTDPIRLGATLPDLVPTEEVYLDAGTVVVANAQQGTGMGSFKLSFEDNNAIGIHIDALTAKEGTYESTITWNLVTGP